jgi:hypothetical protein
MLMKLVLRPAVVDCRVPVPGLVAPSYQRIEQIIMLMREGQSNAASWY